MNFLNGLKSLLASAFEPETVNRTSHFEPYTSIIESAIFKRGSTPGDMEVDQANKAPVYVVNLCRKLVSKIHAEGNQAVTLSDVLRVERSACGHTDYLRKFALYCSRLAEKKPG